MAESFVEIKRTTNSGLNYMALTKELAIECKFGMINSQKSTGTFLGQWSFADTNTNLVVYHLIKKHKKCKWQMKVIKELYVLVHHKWSQEILRINVFYSHNEWALNDMKRFTKDHAFRIRKYSSKILTGSDIVSPWKSKSAWYSLFIEIKKILN